MGKRNTKMGIKESKQPVIVLLGATGGIGEALLEYLSLHTTFIIIPTFNTNLPNSDKFSWMHYNSNEYATNQKLFRTISNIYDIRVIIDLTGAFFASKLQKSNSEEIAKVISTNLIAPLVLAKHAQDFMSNGGQIIFTSSILSSMSIEGSSAYAASKAGLERAILVLASEFSKTGHSICGLRLGYMDYGMTYKLKERIRREMLKNRTNGHFISIDVMGQKIIDLINGDVGDSNGKIYEII